MRRPAAIIVAVLVIIAIFAGCSPSPKVETVNQQLYPFLRVYDNGEIYVAAGAKLKDLVIPDDIQLPNGGVADRFMGYLSEEDKSTLVSVSVAKGIKSIGNDAFKGSEGLREISFAEGSALASIGNSAFESTGITEISIPASVTSVGDNAFADTEITDLTVPARLTDSIKRLFGSGEENPLRTVTVIGSEANRSAIASGAFSDLLGLASVTISGSVSSIGDNAFSGASGLSSVVIMDGVESIGSGAFRNAGTSGLAYTLPASIENVASGAFDADDTVYQTYEIYNNDMLGEPVYSFVAEVQPEPEDISRIINGILGQIKPGPGLFEVENICDADGFDMDYEESGFSPIYSCLPTTGTPGSIGSRIIIIWLDGNLIYSDGNGDGMYSVTLADPSNAPSSVSVSATYRGKYVNEIEAGAFDQVIAVSIADNNRITAIGENAFRGNTAIRHDILANLGTLKTVGSGAFAGTSMSEATIPSEITVIPESMFENASDLRQLINADAGSVNGALQNISTIGANAFKGTKLTGDILKGNNKLSSIGEGAFQNTSIGDADGYLTIPSTVSSIGENAFAGVSTVTALEIPDRVSEIGKGAFGGMAGLESVAIPDSIETIGDVVNAFGCNASGNAVVNSGVTSLEISEKFLTEENIGRIHALFPNITGLHITASSDSSAVVSDLDIFGSLLDLSFDSGVTFESGTIGGSGLKSITVTVDTLNDNALAGSFGTITIENDPEADPANSTEIKQGAFDGISASSVIIKDDVTVGSGAFVENSKITTVTFEGNPTISEGAFGNADISSVVFEGKNTTLTDGAFKDNKHITSVTLPEGLASIPADAFSGAVNLAEAGIPSTVESIGNNAFKDTGIMIEGGSFSVGSNGLVDIVNGSLPDGLESIGSGAFTGDEVGILGDHLVIPESVTTIGDGAFFNPSDSDNPISIAIPAGAIAGGNGLDKIMSATSSDKLFIKDLVLTGDSSAGVLKIASESGSVVISGDIYLEGSADFSGMLDGVGVVSDETDPQSISIHLPQDLAEDDKITIGGFGSPSLVSADGNAGISITSPNGAISAGESTITINGDLSAYVPVNDNGNPFKGSDGKVSKIDSISDGAFAGNKHITALSVSDDTVSIGAGAFQNSGITSIEFENRTDADDAKSLSIGNNAFAGTVIEGDIVFPEGTIMGTGVFGKITGPVDLSGVTQIAVDSFEKDTSFKISVPVQNYTGPDSRPSSFTITGKWDTDSTGLADPDQYPEGYTKFEWVLVDNDGTNITADSIEELTIEQIINADEVRINWINQIEIIVNNTSVQVEPGLKVGEIASYLNETGQMKIEEGGFASPSSENRILGNASPDAVIEENKAYNIYYPLEIITAGGSAVSGNYSVKSGSAINNALMNGISTTKQGWKSEGWKFNVSGTVSSKITATAQWGLYGKGELPQEAGKYYVSLVTQTGKPAASFEIYYFGKNHKDFPGKAIMSVPHAAGSASLGQSIFVDGPSDGYQFMTINAQGPEGRTDVVVELQYLPSLDEAKKLIDLADVDSVLRSIILGSNTFTSNPTTGKLVSVNMAYENMMVYGLHAERFGTGSSWSYTPDLGADSKQNYSFVMLFDVN